MFLSTAWIVCGCFATLSIGQTPNRRLSSSTVTTTEDPFAAIFGFVSFPDTHDPFADALTLDSKVESWANRLLTGDININEIHNSAIQTTTPTPPVQPSVRPQPKATRNNLTPVETRGPETSVNQLPLGLQFLNSRRSSPPRPQPTQIVPIPRDRVQRNGNRNNRLFNTLPPIPPVEQLTGPGGIFDSLFPSLPGEPSNSSSVAIPGDFFAPNFNQRNAPLPTIEMLGLSPESFGLGPGGPIGNTLGPPGSGFQAGGEKGILDTAPSSSLPLQNTALDTSLAGIPSRPSVQNALTPSDPSSSNSILNLLSGSSSGRNNNQLPSGNTVSEQSSGGLTGVLGGGQMSGGIDQGGLNSLATGPEIFGTRSLEDIFGGSNSVGGNVPSGRPITDTSHTQPSSSSLNDLLGGSIASSVQQQSDGLNTIVQDPAVSGSTIPGLGTSSSTNMNANRRMTSPSEADRQIWNSLIPPLPANRNPVETFGNIGDGFPSIPTIDQQSGSGLQGTESSLPPTEPRSSTGQALDTSSSQIPSIGGLGGVSQASSSSSQRSSETAGRESQATSADNTNVRNVPLQTLQRDQSSTQNVESIWQNLVNEIPALDQLAGSPTENLDPNAPFQPINTVGQTNTDTSIPQIPTIEQLFPGFSSIDQLAGATSNTTNSVFSEVSGISPLEGGASSTESNANLPFPSLDQLAGGSSNVDQGIINQENPTIPSLSQITGGTSSGQASTNEVFPVIPSLDQLTGTSAASQDNINQVISSLEQMTRSTTTQQESTNSAFPAIPSLDQLSGGATNGLESTNQAFPAISSIDQLSGGEGTVQENTNQAFPAISSIDQLLGGEIASAVSTNPDFQAVSSLDQLTGDAGVDQGTGNQAFPSIASLEQLTSSTETTQESSQAFPAIPSLNQLTGGTSSSQGSNNLAFPAITTVNQNPVPSTAVQRITSDIFPGIPTIDQLAGNIADVVAASTNTQTAAETGFPAIPTIEEIANAVASNTRPNQPNPANPSATRQIGQTLQVTTNQGTPQLQNRNINQAVGTGRNSFLNIVSDPNPSGTQAPNVATNIGLPLNPFALQRQSNSGNANGLLVVDIQSPQAGQTQGIAVPNQTPTVGNSNSRNQNLNFPQIPNNLLGIPNNLLRNRQQLQRLRTLQQIRQQQQGLPQFQQGQTNNIFRRQQQQQIIQPQQGQQRQLQSQQQQRQLQQQQQQRQLQSQQQQLQQQQQQQQLQQQQQQRQLQAQQQQQQLQQQQRRLQLQQLQQQRVQQLRQHLLQLQRQRQQQSGLNSQNQITNPSQGSLVPGNSQIQLGNTNQALNQNLLNQGLNGNNQQQSSSFVDPVINALVNLNQLNNFNQQAPAIAPTSAPLPRTQLQNNPVGVLTRDQFLRQMNAFRLGQLARRIQSFTPPATSTNVQPPTTGSPGIVPIARNGLFGPQGNLLQSEFALNRIRDAQLQAIRLAVDRQLPLAQGNLQNTVTQPGRRFDLIDRSQIGLPVQQQFNPTNFIQGPRPFDLGVPFNDAVNNLLVPNAALPGTDPNNFDLSMRMNDQRLVNGFQLPTVNILNPTSSILPNVLPVSEALERVERARILMNDPNPFRQGGGLGIPGVNINRFGQGLSPILPVQNFPTFVGNPERFIIPLNGSPPVSFPRGIGNPVDSPLIIPGFGAPGPRSWLHRQLNFLGNGGFI